MFHKTSITRYDKHKFDWKVKQKKPVDTLTETPPTSRKTISARNVFEKCFFCEKLETCDTLHSCQKLYLHNRIYKIAHELADTKLLEKLSEGDMVATKAKYHRKCLLHFYNCYHIHNIQKLEETTNLEVIKVSFIFV